MRHLFLILMIALLPLRGWVSDAMATGMGVVQAQNQQQSAVKLIAAHTHELGAQAHFDTETAVAESGQPSADCSSHAFVEKAHSADAHCDSCVVCQVCHTVALSPMAASLTAAFSLHTSPNAFGVQFASADSALGQKPPIS